MSFSRSLATKCVSLNIEPCIATITLIDLNLIELNYYPFMISLDKCNGSCNVVNDLSKKICVPSETKDVNIKVYNMITRINKAIAMAKHIPYDCEGKFDSTTCNSNQKWNTVMINVKVSVKSIVHAKRIIL